MSLEYKLSVSTFTFWTILSYSLWVGLPHSLVERNTHYCLLTSFGITHLGLMTYEFFHNYIINVHF
jgi:hypothetical protein